ncbi:unnamed protein product [Amoebophrya sp. A25]|nr:unnamed protein product [Amoebophrya sp. A25]|eukprot:GSA25T00027943001.1
MGRYAFSSSVVVISGYNFSVILATSKISSRLAGCLRAACPPLAAEAVLEGCEGFGLLTYTEDE